MNWLLNLYDQGINGILADEMGLGKTVQALAMLAHIAEHYNIWGPFLVVTPASTLHNWQQEVCESSKYLITFVKAYLINIIYTIQSKLTYRKVASNRPVYYSILNSLVLISSIEYFCP